VFTEKEVESMKPTVLDVGQCDMDHASIRRVAEGIGARVLRARTEEEALALMEREPIDLVLVNRIFDYDGSEGLNLVKKLTGGATNGRKVMLVSNYPDYQEQAVALGAVQGFGKAELRNPETAERLKGVLKGRAE
jgi:response regulator RpfG family c-di-GMP phosphodiesterase